MASGLGLLPGHSTAELHDWLVVEDPEVFETKLCQAFFGRPDAEVAGVVEPGEVAKTEARGRNDANLEVNEYGMKNWFFSIRPTLVTWLWNLAII